MDQNMSQQEDGGVTTCRSLGPVIRSQQVAVHVLLHSSLSSYRCIIWFNKLSRLRAIA
jgi:hypothetical protein